MLIYKQLLELIRPGPLILYFISFAINRNIQQLYHQLATQTIQGYFISDFTHCATIFFTMNHSIFQCQLFLYITISKLHIQNLYNCLCTILYNYTKMFNPSCEVDNQNMSEVHAQNSTGKRTRNVMDRDYHLNNSNDPSGQVQRMADNDFQHCKFKSIFHSHARDLIYKQFNQLLLQNYFSQIIQQCVRSSQIYSEKKYKQKMGKEYKMTQNNRDVSRDKLIIFNCVYQFESYINEVRNQMTKRTSFKAKQSNKSQQTQNIENIFYGNFDSFGSIQKIMREKQKSQVFMQSNKAMRNLLQICSLTQFYCLQIFVRLIKIIKIIDVAMQFQQQTIITYRKNIVKLPWLASIEQLQPKQRQSQAKLIYGEHIMKNCQPYLNKLKHQIKQTLQYYKLTYFINDSCKKTKLYELKYCLYLLKHQINKNKSKESQVVWNFIYQKIDIDETFQGLLSGTQVNQNDFSWIEDSIYRNNRLVWDILDYRQRKEAHVFKLKNLKIKFKNSVDILQFCKVKKQKNTKLEKLKKQYKQRNNQRKMFRDEALNFSIQKSFEIYNNSLNGSILFNSYDSNSKCNKQISAIKLRQNSFQDRTMQADYFYKKHKKIKKIKIKQDTRKQNLLNSFKNPRLKPEEQILNLSYEQLKKIKQKIKEKKKVSNFQEGDEVSANQNQQLNQSHLDTSRNPLEITINQEDEQDQANLKKSHNRSRGQSDTLNKVHKISYESMNLSLNQNNTFGETSADKQNDALNYMTPKQNHRQIRQQNQIDRFELEQTQSKNKKPSTKRGQTQDKFWRERMCLPFENQQIQNAENRLQMQNQISLKQTNQKDINEANNLYTKMQQPKTNGNQNVSNISRFNPQNRIHFNKTKQAFHSRRFHSHANRQKVGMNQSAIKKLHRPKYTIKKQVAAEQFSDYLADSTPPMKKKKGQSISFQNKI